MGATQRVFVGLDVEWALVCADLANGALVRGIEEAGVAAAGDLPQELRELVAHLAARRDAAFSDRWLLALLDHAAGEQGEAQLAARVIVQAKGGRRGRGNPTPAPLNDLGAVGVRIVGERVSERHPDDVVEDGLHGGAGIWSEASKLPSWPTPATC
ncbi:hypothetical protein ACFRAI_43580 [Streptomyces sp. NPDC056637]|uniref:hypothetical protein n=1 Tax=unclassified Streptomyces TaxID=2593676 RepID=UPI003683BCE9